MENLYNRYKMATSPTGLLAARAITCIFQPQTKSTIAAVAINAVKLIRKTIVQLIWFFHWLFVLSIVSVEPDLHSRVRKIILTVRLHFANRRPQSLGAKIT